MNYLALKHLNRSFFKKSLFFFSTNPKLQPYLDLFTKDINDNKVFVFMKGTRAAPMCSYSTKMLLILNKERAIYNTRDVLQEEMKAAIKVFSNWDTIPQLYINKEFIGGVDIVSELFVNGELTKLLQAVNAIDNK